MSPSPRLTYDALPPGADGPTASGWLRRQLVVALAIGLGTSVGVVDRVAGLVRRLRVVGHTSKLRRLAAKGQWSR